MGRARPAIDIETLVQRAESLVERHGAVPKTEMKAFRSRLAELGPRLVERGLEVGTTIRRPLGKQLLELAATEPLLVKGLERRVVGGSRPEVKAALDSLVAEGRLVPIVRDTGPAITIASAPVLEDSDVRALLAACEKLVKLLKTAKRTKRRILRGDVGSFAGPTAPARPATSSNDDVLQEIARRVRAVAAPTHVPALLRSMGLSAETGRKALLDGAARGLFVLEPESGMGRLSREDADLCPPGPMGTHLSWVRARMNQGARS